jgi:hypothetical protein
MQQPCHPHGNRFMRIAAIGVSHEIGNSSVDRQSYVAFVIEVVATLGLSISEKQKPPGFAGRFFVFTKLASYSPPPKRRDHHPARRGWVSVAVSEVGCSAGAGAGAGDGAGSAWLTDGGAAGCASTKKLTFSRTVERRFAALSASCAAVSTSAGTCAGSC